MSTLCCQTFIDRCHIPYPSSGVVRVSLADMDRETRENYSVVIQAKDMGGQLGGLAGTTTINITLSDINDNPPVFDQSKTASCFSIRQRTKYKKLNSNVSFNK